MNAKTLTDSKTQPQSACPEDDALQNTSVSQQLLYMTMLARIDAHIESNDLAAARRLLRYLDDKAPTNAVVNEQIAATAGLLQDWPVMLRALTSLIHHAQPDDEIDDLVFRSVQLLVEKLNSPDKAVILIRDYFHSFIGFPNSVAWTKQHLLRGPYRQILINIARTHIVQPLESQLNVNVFNALGSWYAVRPDQYRSAFQWYRKTLSIMPGNPEAIDGLISLLN